MNQSDAQPYDTAFYEGVQRGAIVAARKVLPIVLNWLAARSVVDVGCGEGTWLMVARELGLTDSLGLDGDYVDRARLLVPKECFRAADLNQPVVSDRRFDLAMCMEVGEHLTPDAGRQLVRSLTSLSTAVLFSAAIPGQGGTDHINEQWPDYWAAIFRERGYVAIDGIRRRVWDDLDAAWWYAQNAILYVHGDVLSSNPALAAEAKVMPDPPIRMVHPKLHAHVRALLAATEKPSLRAALRQVRDASAAAIQRRLSSASPQPDSAPAAQS